MDYNELKGNNDKEVGSEEYFKKINEKEYVGFWQRIKRSIIIIRFWETTQAK